MRPGPHCVISTAKLYVCTRRRTSLRDCTAYSGWTSIDLLPSFTGARIARRSNGSLCHDSRLPAAAEFTWPPAPPRSVMLNQLPGLSRKVASMPQMRSVGSDRKVMPRPLSSA